MEQTIRSVLPWNISGKITWGTIYGAFKVTSRTRQPKLGQSMANVQFNSSECQLPPKCDVVWVQTANTADNIYTTLSNALSNVPARLGYKGLVFGNSSDKPLANSTVGYVDGWVWWIRMAGRKTWKGECVVRSNSKAKLLLFLPVCNFWCQITEIKKTSETVADCVNRYPYFCYTFLNRRRLNCMLKQNVPVNLWWDSHHWSSTLSWGKHTRMQMHI